jgi:hypothetical protein
MVKYGYSKDVLSLNTLIDKNLDQQVELNSKLESNMVKRSEETNELNNHLDFLIG